MIQTNFEFLQSQGFSVIDWSIVGGVPSIRAFSERSQRKAKRLRQWCSAFGFHLKIEKRFKSGENSCRKDWYSLREVHEHFQISRKKIMRLIDNEGLEVCRRTQCCLGFRMECCYFRKREIEALELPRRSKPLVPLP